MPPVGTNPIVLRVANPLWQRIPSNIWTELDVWKTASYGVIRDHYAWEFGADRYVQLSDIVAGLIVADVPFHLSFYGVEGGAK